MLARLAAGAHNSQSGDDEAAIEKYLRSVLSLENILTLDRLRQVDGGNVRAPYCSSVPRLSHFNMLEMFAGSGGEGAADEPREEQQKELEFSFSPQGKKNQPQTQYYCVVY